MGLAACDELAATAATLRETGVCARAFGGRGERETPDSILPNNRLSPHCNNYVALYPMQSPGRRRERRTDVIEMLAAEYRVQGVIDCPGLEHDDLFLRDTGAVVLDPVANVACTARSQHADLIALKYLCNHLNFEPMAFTPADASGLPAHHTHAMTCVATAFALVGVDRMDDPKRRAEVRARQCA